MRVLHAVPAFNAASTLGNVLAELVAHQAHVLVVDDGSADGTPEVACAAGADVVRHHGNRGKGVALRTALAWALHRDFDQLVTLDADGQHLPDEALRLAVHPAPPDTLVLGIRDLVGDGAPRANQLSNSISNYFLSLFSGHPLRDTQCGLRRYPVKRTLDLGATATGFGFEADVVLRAARAGWPIEQVPVRVVYPAEEQRTSHFHVVRDPARIVGRIVATLATT